MGQTETDRKIDEMHAMMRHIVEMLEQSVKQPVDALAQLHKALPVELQLPEREMRVLARAVEGGLITLEPEGHLCWHGQPILLAYLCGRLWCGDWPDKDGNFWHPGERPFPGTALVRLFGKANIKQRRSKSVWDRLPKNHAIVDVWLAQE